MDRILRSILMWSLACGMATAALPTVTVLSAHAQDQGSLVQAQSLYDQGRFADALKQVQAGLDGGKFTGGEKVRAKELIARCQVKTGAGAAGRATFLSLLRQDPLYRPDALRVPPDEMNEFNAARATFEEEQRSARQRIPASIGAFYGTGSGDNSDFGEYVKAGGGDDKFENTPIFGLGVRFPLRPKLSIDLELQRFRATNEDSVTGPAQAKYELSALPVVVSLHYLVHDGGKLRASVFAGGGPMLQSYASDAFLFFGSIPIKVTDSKVGTYLHAGIEGEYLLTPRFSVNARLLGRSAKATKMFEDSEFTQYSGVLLADRDIDFSGVGLTLGLRGYIGY